MYGVEFLDVNNCLICGICGVSKVEIHKYTSRGYESKVYEISSRPDTGLVIRDSGGKLIKSNAQPEDLEAILPKRNDFGKEWTYADFMLAMIFFGDGQKRGVNQEWYGAQQEINQLKKKLEEKD